MVSLLDGAEMCAYWGKAIVKRKEKERGPRGEKWSVPNSFSGALKSYPDGILSEQEDYFYHLQTFRDTTV